MSIRFAPNVGPYVVAEFLVHFSRYGDALEAGHANVELSCLFAANSPPKLLIDAPGRCVPLKYWVQQ